MSGEENQHTQSFNVDPAMLNEVIQKADSMLRQISSLKTSKDIDNAVRRWREIIATELGGGSLPYTLRKKQNDFVEQFFTAWLLQFAKHSIDARYEVDELVRLLNRYKKQLPTDTDKLHKKVYDLRNESKDWAEVTATINGAAWESMEDWQREVATDKLQKAHKQYLRRNKIRFKLGK